MKAAIKALRQTKKRTARNLQVKETIAFLRRSLRKAMDAKEVKKAEELAAATIKAVDKAIQKGVLKLNTGGRIKSRLSKRLNALKKK